ncbi:MAG: hypothetical protein LC768_12070 [Acidobacteria bacterium]|nr:hypothetical protein [Acidobacteriota bacterium]MCA1639047.1 hypothetical protein [Acidobacteriota bacterium]
MPSMTKYSYSLWILVLFLSVDYVFTQSRDIETIRSFPASGAYCELNSAYLDVLVNEQKKSGERIFVISRLGKGERTSLNDARLTGVKNYLVEKAAIEKERVVFAEGDRTNGVGILEFYLGSKLFLVIEKSQNNVGCLDCCEEP